jgi:signal transduction histidine kinase
VADFSDRSHRLFRVAVWITALIPAIVPFFALDPRYRQEPIGLWLLGYLTFVAAMWAAETGRRPWAGLVGVQIVAALAATLAFPSSVEGAMLVAAAAQIAGRARLRIALAVAVAQTIAFAALLARSRPLEVALDVPLAWFAFQAFAVLLTHVARSEAEGRAALLERNLQLLATRQLLADHARAAERLRIARNLHDGLGHHLTALSLNLEAAAHLGDGATREHIARAQRVTRALLDETRASVADAREAALDPIAAIRAMLAPIDSPHVHLEAPAALPVADAARAEAVTRVVQEIVTNALRHAAARNLWISVRAEGGDVEVRGRDDGHGAAAWRDGHGLRGMRERLTALGGTLDVASQPGAGFTVAARLPLGGAAR